ncbi:MAG: bi-domain-containing oxidoreductase [Verrucomicrobiae bacterium]|nr:bi-domain-containing oxidoreductase [Verrucomicrobiae bacterium]
MQLLIARQGKVDVVTAPDPAPAEHEVLIQTYYSCISPGTELQALSQQSLSVGNLARRACRSWDKVKASLSRRGWKQTLARVSQAIDKPLTLGYSLSGRVLKSGDAVHSFGPGDWVAAVGPWAGHGTMACVPQKFCAPVPRPEMLGDAASAALACTALHATHRAELPAGSEVAVFGLGSIGQFAVEILRLSGHQVVAFDPVASRRQTAEETGAKCYDPLAFDFEQTGASLSSHGQGLDAVFLCAKARSSELVGQAISLCRKRGRLIIVGEFPIEISREQAYHKELVVRFSAAYGEGRYDPAYEYLDQDYPIEFCRWTVERNLRLFMQWLDEGRLAPSRQQPQLGKFEKAPTIYQDLLNMPTAEAPLLTLLEYNELLIQKPMLRLVTHSAPHPNAIPLAVIGVGRFATETHLPNLSQNTGFQVAAIVGRQPARVARTAARFKIPLATCDYKQILQDKSIASVLIATPHASHCAQVLDAMDAGKHVLVEKPLCINLDELALIEAKLTEIRRAGRDQALFVGFNRRFAPVSQSLLRAREKHHAPVEIRYEYLTPPLPSGEWYNRPEQGGRFIGEVCHAVDWILWLVGAPLANCSVTPSLGGAGADVTLIFNDDSRAHLHHRPVERMPSGPKEKVEVSAGENRWLIEDFLCLRQHRHDQLIHEEHSRSKGHRELLDAFAAAIAQPASGADPYGFIASSRLVIELASKAKG